MSDYKIKIIPSMQCYNDNQAFPNVRLLGIQVNHLKILVIHAVDH
jgi:hypothetical protein